MTIVIAIVVIILGLLGIIGCILPVIPGPPMSWVGLLLIYFFGKGCNSEGEPMSLIFLMIWLAITVAVTVIDYIIPSYLAKVSGGSPYASRGAIAGLLVGLFFAPLGIIFGPMVGAFAAEAIFSGKSASASIWPALGAFGGFLCGTGIKLIACGFMFYYMIVYLF